MNRNTLKGSIVQPFVHSSEMISDSYMKILCRALDVVPWVKVFLILFDVIKNIIHFGIHFFLLCYFDIDEEFVFYTPILISSVLPACHDSYKAQDCSHRLIHEFIKLYFLIHEKYHGNANESHSKNFGL